MGVLFDECAQRGTDTRVHLDRPFDIAPDSGRDHDVASLAALVRDAAGWLAAAGARRADRIAIVKADHWDYDLLACAAVRLGAVPAQLSAHLSGESLGVLLKRLEPAVLVTDAAMLERCREQGVDIASFARVVLALGDPVEGALALHDVLGAQPPAPRSRDDAAPLVIHHTSGTTGVPKLVVHSTRTIIGKLARFESNRIPRIGLRTDDTLLNANTFAHGRTFCWTASAMCLAPKRITILTDHDPDRADPVLRAHPPTVVEALPATYVRLQRLTERLDNPFRRVRLFVSTYDAMHPPAIRAYLAASRHRSPLWMQGWGQTETGPLTFRFHTRGSMVSKYSRKPGTRNLGRAVPFKTGIKVVDPDTFEPVRRGRPGLVFTRTEALCLGYVGEMRRWSAKRVGDWWNTGDIGVRNRDGSVLLLDREVDRADGMSCLEIEDILDDRLREVQECVVLACQDRPPLPVAVTEDGALDRAAWQRAVRDLPRMQDPVPLTWQQVPRTGTGKVRRLDLLEQLTGCADTYGSGRWT
ncbi:acyl-CoA synthetase [Saccharopolyspora erythraea]|uniref:AMP-binding protein n=1 Tax=Saccharopolyspora erythraea TaxID=1836 RepID=UPI001BA4D015|nr:AMP-binding protein [Saccharopolyspora erythraea]QUH06156.1 acyl-CoA synthetase [Saccharopolyspora erythraea]